MPFTLKNLVDLVAPQYLLISIVAPISCFMMINSNLPGLRFFLVVISFSLLALGFNTANAIFDATIDAVNKPRRPIPSGRVKIKEAAWLSIAFYALGLIIAAFVNATFAALMVLFVIITLFYNLPNIKLRNHFLGSNVTGLVIYGVIPFLSAFSVSPPSKAFPWVFFIAFSLLYGIVSSSKDFEDVVGEKDAGRKSMPIVFGEVLTAKTMIFVEFLMLAALGAAALLGVIDQKFLYAVLFSLLMLVGSASIFWREILAMRTKNVILKHSYKGGSEQLRTIVLQSNAVTASILFIILAQLIFGLVSLL